ncbi:hypothetical protein D7Y13_27000 [Corallococcus praedator]|uniref:Lipoprotein n=1 Tax=Corallococcus praedator TaxID=2316724 RepID=A0ABX9QCP8_9BACT|nr:MULTISPECIES: hypothetical protein [Corallococcus]RKH08756.1 hypothetical protein D7X74_30955 [Corallococcus sp. CA047B]RKH23966.1 hypothetical protein D7X75_32805 [Corallococcus sp. CA031C]RKH99962.1 hypothetical protein D7Y13_27000 [Corallococcus praedator]
MRMTLLLGLLSVGLLAACGGVEPEAQDSDVTGQALRPPPCEFRCDLLHELCINEAGTREAQALCDSQRAECKLACAAPAAQAMEASAIPPCPELCARAYHRCKLLAKTPEDFELCGCWNYQCMDSCAPLSPGSTGTAAYDVTCDG